MTTPEPLELFHPVIQEWFKNRFGEPTAVQLSGWPVIATRRATLITAPTGAGKTLAAFLLCLDRLFRDAIAGRLTDMARVVYVSPLKALSGDVHKNLSAPLEEITRLAHERGMLLQDIHVALRTGDTPAHERAARARRPPHIWVTTPESLYILLTSESGRRGMAQVDTLILDEIHAVADTKRGAHLALSVERLQRLVGRPMTRIGLSATLRPLEAVAGFLAGMGNTMSEDAHTTSDANAAGGAAIVNAGQRRDMELRVEMPDMELGPVATRELWEETITRLARLVEAHQTTLVFVNTRRLAERVAHQLGEKLGEERVAAHHGSLSWQTRLQTEARLKSGEIRVCVATASLELGIDIGAVDLVCQIGSPRSIGVLLQRVGRSGHRLGALPRGRIFPLTRDELVECAALLYAVRQDELDRLHIPRWPLDIMAQQITAMCAVEDWRLDDLFAVIRRAYSYSDLPRPHFDAVIRMLTDGAAPRLGRTGAWLHYDAVHGMVRARRGARLAAITSGGAIPDTADYDVINEIDGTRVGSVYEDFAFESMIGDVFLLGNTSWRIRRVEKGRVLVEDAHGQAPDIPFWIGEAPARTAELSRCVAAVRRGIACRLENTSDPEGAAAVVWLTTEVGLTEAAAAQLCAYIAEGLRVLGEVPSDRHVIAERFFDETGGMQLVLHAPFGASLNKAWGLLLRRRIGCRFDADLQAAATDDGISLALTPQHAFALEDFLTFSAPENIERDLLEAVASAPLFRTRWRWTLTRSLTLLRFAGGRKVPPPLLRMRADDLLAAIAPGTLAAATEENQPRHPLVFETLRDCFQEAMDVAGLTTTLRRIQREEIRFSARDTTMPSVFAHQILNAMPYAFLDNAPLEERRARAVTLRRALPESAGELGRLDPEAIRAATADAWPPIRDAEELHDALYGWVLFPENQRARLPRDAETWLLALSRDGRAASIERNGQRYWVAHERMAEIPAPGHAESMLALARGWAETSGPFVAAELATMLGFPFADIMAALERLERDGMLLRGFFSDRARDKTEEFCDRRILARIHRATVSRLRREAEPAPAALFLRFLCRWQHIAPGCQLTGESGTLDVIQQLQGFEAAAAAWEREILGDRIKAYQPEFLDSLCMCGDVVWGRWRRRETGAEQPARRPGLSRVAPVGLGLRDDLLWLLEAAIATDAMDDTTAADTSAAREREYEATQLSATARSVLRYLRQHGASFFQEVVLGVRQLPTEVEEALWQLVAAGLVSADAFAALRALANGENKRIQRARRRPRPARRSREGRWFLLDALGGREQPERRHERWARQLLDRYGVFCRELLTRETAAPSWRFLLPILRRLEARGEIRGGRFIMGLYGEQFALPDAVAALRQLRAQTATGQYTRVSACDPLNLAGIITPGHRVTALPGNKVVFRDGVPVAAVENGRSQLLVAPATLEHIDAREKATLARYLDERPLEPPV